MPVLKVKTLKTLGTPTADALELQDAVKMGAQTCGVYNLIRHEAVGEPAKPISRGLVYARVANPSR